MPDVAIAHKDYDVRGGGEVLSECLAEALDAPLYVGRLVDENVPADLDQAIHEIDLARWQRWAIRRGGAPRSFAYMLAWQTAHEDLPDYDVVVASGNEPLWYVPSDDQAFVAYTHSTPRFQYDLFHERDHGLFDLGYNTAVRSLYLPNVRKPDLWLANSDVVARRMNLYWDVPTDAIRVVYPPVDVASYDPTAAPTEDVYLHLGRLAGHKRVGDLVDAFRGRDERLVIAGDGPERPSLERQAPPNVDVLGYVAEERKRTLYARAKALLFPAENEDFGMVPVEAMAAGTPVIGVKEGFTQYQIQHGENGLLYDRDGGAGLARALDHFGERGVAWGDDAIAGWAAEYFSRERFVEEMQQIVDTAASQAAVSPAWEDRRGRHEREVFVE